MNSQKYKERCIKDGKLSMPESWLEINPEDALGATHVAICVDGERIGVYYVDCETSQLTKEWVVEIEGRAKNLGFRNAINIYGLIEEDIHRYIEALNPYGAEIIRYGKEIKDND